LQKILKDLTRMNCGRLGLVAGEGADMDKRMTHFEQVPLEVAKKVAEKEIKRKETRAKTGRRRPKTAGGPVEATILAGIGGLI
jgi:hypothetical protein